MPCRFVHAGVSAFAILVAVAPGLQSQAQSTGKDLKVRIVVQTATNVYQPVWVPANTVVSVLPANSVIIRCPSVTGLAGMATADCFENGLAPTTIIKLTAPTPLVPNATFFKWMDIPGTGGLPISNMCTYSSFMPNIQCAMAGTRFIQAVYKCNDTFTYSAATRTCEKGDPPVALCTKIQQNVSLCRAAIQVRRKTVGPNTYTVTVSPSALTPSMNPLPSTSVSCVNVGNSLLQTHCGFSFNWNPTAVTLTAVSSTGALPPGFLWSGACTGSSPTCVLNIVPNAGATNSAVANFP